MGRPWDGGRPRLFGLEEGERLQAVGVRVFLVCGAALVLGAGAGSASASQASPGALQICEAGDGGASDQTFSFTAAKGSTSVRVTVPGGSCAAPISAVPGNWQITQDENPPWEQTGASIFPLSAFVSENDAAGRVRANVSSGAATQVTLIDKQADATIEVCPWSSSPGLQNDDFTFDISGRSVTAPAGWSRDSAGCSAPVSADSGTKLKLDRDAARRRVGRRRRDERRTPR